MRCAPIGLLCLALTFTLGSSFITAQDPQTAPATKPVQAPTAGRGRQSPAPGPKLSFTVMVTALDGKTIPEATVKASGPVDREMPTDPSGLVTFANMAPGTYRLRIEHPEVHHARERDQPGGRQASARLGVAQRRAAATATTQSRTGPAPTRACRTGRQLCAQFGRHTGPLRKEFHWQ